MTSAKEMEGLDTLCFFCCFCQICSVSSFAVNSNFQKPVVSRKTLASTGPAPNAYKVCLLVVVSSALVVVSSALVVVSSALVVFSSVLVVFSSVLVVFTAVRPADPQHLGQLLRYCCCLIQVKVRPTLCSRKDSSIYL